MGAKMNTGTIVTTKNGMVRVKRFPRFEGSNICTWIGFKHVMYLLEEAAIQYFREQQLFPRQLFDENGLCFEIVESNARIMHALHMDDEVDMEVCANCEPADTEMSLRINAFVRRGQDRLKAVSSNIKVLFRHDQTNDALNGNVATVGPYTTSMINRDGANAISQSAEVVEGRGVIHLADDDVIRQVVPRNANALIWKWRIPYFYCHFTERIQHSGYLRLVEEVVDLFLADRGISIRTMLDTRGWIPVVPHAHISILKEALMEETIYTVYTVEEIFKNMRYTSRVDCYVPRNGALLHTATGSITHGYAQILNRRDWALINFDAATIAALTGVGSGHGK